MAVDLFVQDDNNFILDVPSNDTELQVGQPVVTRIENDYEELRNLPQINHVTLIGDKSFEDLGLIIDQELDEQSNNPVANAAVVAGLSTKQDTLTFDQTPTEGSNNPVTSDGIYNAILNAVPEDEIFWATYQVTSYSDVLSNYNAGKLVAMKESTYVYLATCKVPTAIWFTSLSAGDTTHAYELKSTNQWVYHTHIIPAKTSDLQNDSDFITSSSLPTKTSDLINDGADDTSVYVEADELATVATSGSYDDLLNQPSIPAAQVNSDWNANSGVAEILNKPSLATVATSGDYNDLQNKPTIPAAQVNADWDAVSGVAEILNKPTIPAAQVNADWNANSGVAEILNKPTVPAAGIPSGGNAGQILKKNSATDYDVHWADQTQYYPSGYSTTGADKQTKQIACSSWTATAKSYLHILLTHANTYAGKLYFTVNAVNTYEVWINGEVSSATNYTLPAGTYIIYFDGSAFQVRTDGIIPASVTGTAARIPYGECDNTSTSTAFTATVPGITELKDGVTMLLYNGVVTSASGFTINVNGLGAKPSYNNMTLGNPVTPTNPTRDTTIFNINYAFLFVYSETLVSGGCWIGYRGYDANTNTIGYQLRTNQTTMPTADKFYRYRLLFTSADGTKWVPANTSTSTNTTAIRTPNTRAIDPFGEIVWYGTTTAIDANANVTAAQLWQEYYGSYTNIGYSFNNTGSAATMTANTPIYIVCTPQADGSAIIDPTTPYTQTLPSSADGKIYIYLGRAYNATNFEILMNHPVYYHNGENVVIYDGHMHINLLSSSYNISGSIGSATLALDSSLFKELEFDVKGPRTVLVSSTTYAERRSFKVPVSEGGFVISDYNIANAIMNDIAIYWSGTTVTNQNSTSPLLPGYTIEQIIGHI